MNFFLMAQETAGAPPQQSMLTAMLPLVVIFVIFYFLVIMPQRRKEKKHREMLDALKGGERVLTSSGIFGTVTRVTEDRFEIEIATGTRIWLAKGYIAGLVEEQQDKEAKK